MNYNGYPQNMSGMYNSYPYPQMPNQSMMPKYEVIKVKGKPGVDAFHGCLIVNVVKAGRKSR